MRLHHKTLEKLRDLINEEIEYRTAPKLVQFFNLLGFSDTYAEGFPARRRYTDDKLSQINGTPQMEACIKQVFSGHYFIGRTDALEFHIQSFNKYLALDQWQILRQATGIILQPATPQSLADAVADDSLAQFLSQEFDKISLEKLGFEPEMTAILTQRLEEIKICLSAGAPLAIIFLTGSALEGVLMGVAQQNQADFMRVVPSLDRQRYAGERSDKLDQWRLTTLIDAAAELGYLRQDVKRFSHSLRDFRNYIHPYKQLNTGFQPNMYTAQICWQVLKAALFQLTENR